MEENIDNHSDENFDQNSDENLEFDEVEGESSHKDESPKTELDLDSFFKGKKKQSDGNDGEPSLDSSDEDLIDTRDPNALIKKLQSQRDKLANRTKSLEVQVKTSLGAKEFLNNFHEDENFRLAVIRKYHPDLIKPLNTGEFIRTKLAEEFKDFQYDPSQRENIGSDHWAYAVRSQELLKEVMEKKNGANLKTLEDIEKEVGTKNEKAKTQMLNNRKAAMKKFGWDVEGVKAFEQSFLKKISYLDLASIYSNMFENIDESFTPALKGGSKESLRKKSRGVQTDDELFGTDSFSF
jgi:hypothetical protein